MGHFLFQSIFYLSVIFKMPWLSIFIQFLQLWKVQALRSPMTTLTSQKKLWQVIFDQRGSQSVNPLQSEIYFNFVTSSSQRF